MIASTMNKKKKTTTTTTTNTNILLLLFLSFFCTFSKNKNNDLNVVSAFTFLPHSKNIHFPSSSSSASFTKKSILYSTTSSDSTTTTTSNEQPYKNVLILDHLNINHEKNHHDYIQAFYYDFLKFTPDPRKAENLEKGRGTLWANIGAHQMHLPEGKHHAQVLEGIITLVYPTLDGLMERSDDKEGIVNILGDSKFSVKVMDSSEDNGEVTALQVTDPWGTIFHIVKSKNVQHDKEYRGTQKDGDLAEGIGMKDLTLFVPPGANLDGIGRFYEQILGAPVLSPQNDNDDDDDKVVISMGPKQTLTFCVHPQHKKDISHVDMRDEEEEEPETTKETDDKPHYQSNYGPHISMYISDIRSTYQRIEDLGITYVNPRFKRRAYTLEEVVDDCMFRVIDIVDPNDEEKKVILRLEHEVRSVVKRDGSLYKSCPFVEIPEGCVI